MNNLNNKIKQICIFCGKTDKEVSFNREHLIPQSIGGKLYLDDCVCSLCNSFLGTKIDSEILKMPEILNAFESLNIKHDKDGILNRNYEITGSTDDNLELRYGKIIKNKLIFPAQKLPDGSIIVPEKEYPKKLIEMVKKDKRLKEAGLSEMFINQKLKELIDKYNKSNVGEKTVSPELGITLLKRYEIPKPNFNPKKKANILPLVSKIAYEFLFFIGGALFFKDENIKIQEQLIESINSGKPEKGLVFSRENPSFNTYKFLHFIFLEFYPNFAIIRVVFFGHLQFMVLVNKLSDEYKENIEIHVGIKNIRSIMFQQVLDKPSKSFWIQKDDDSWQNIFWI